MFKFSHVSLMIAFNLRMRHDQDFDLYAVLQVSRV